MGKNLLILNEKENSTPTKGNEKENPAPTGGKGKNFICIHILILSLHTGAGTSRPGILIIIPLETGFIMGATVRPRSLWNMITTLKCNT